VGDHWHFKRNARLCACFPERFAAGLLDIEVSRSAAERSMLQVS